jgi:hypothetical protein
VRSDVVIIRGFISQLSSSDGGIDRSRRRIGFGEQGPAVDLADQLFVQLDTRIGPDDLQVDDGPAWAYRTDHVAKDVHDALGIHSSE